MRSVTELRIGSVGQIVMIQKRHPDVARIIVVSLPRENASSLAAVKIIDQELRDHLYLPSWEEFAERTGKKTRRSFGVKWIRRMAYTFHAELMRS